MTTALTSCNLEVSSGFAGSRAAADEAHTGQRVAGGEGLALLIEIGSDAIWFAAQLSKSMEERGTRDELSPHAQLVVVLLPHVPPLEPGLLQQLRGERHLYRPRAVDSAEAREGGVRRAHGRAELAGD
eukprot:CAMPEP_0183360848 /NCGR_PEP_ID=MMETSP0164_2-20130417/56111_1 /TAXON_ID=221442 /ORGANISM="Coccolithus pelagicus ssp braarudi, Strain PLY182g" /LENGTH=127 /DNA_ID=CAMNT_0025535289 /DNA_START=204 /DNA_END=588 /DNA_ORIENTATION=-